MAGRTRSSKRKNSLGKKNSLPLVPKRELGQKGYKKGGLLGLRSTHFKKVVTKTGETVELKTDAVINPKKIDLKDSPKLEALKNIYYKKIREIPSNRRTIITERSINGSPLKGHTPTKKTPMYAYSKYGFLTFMTNKEIPSHTRITAEKVDASFLASDAFKSAPKVTESKKKQSFVVRSNTHHSKKLRTSQNAYMGDNSATDYVRATKLCFDLEEKENKENIKPDEWNHLRAHDFGGGQKDNLVACSSRTNTGGMLTDQMIRNLANPFKKIEVDVEAPLIPETHVAKYIEYTIRHESFSLSARLENTPVTPHIIEKEYFSCFRKALVEEILGSPTPTP